MLRSEAAVGGAIRLSTVTGHDPVSAYPPDSWRTGGGVSMERQVEP